MMALYKISGKSVRYYLGFVMAVHTSYLFPNEGPYVVGSISSRLPHQANYNLTNSAYHAFIRRISDPARTLALPHTHVCSWR